MNMNLIVSKLSQGSGNNEANLKNGGFIGFAREKDKKPIMINEGSLKLVIVNGCY